MPSSLLAPIPSPVLATSELAGGRVYTGSGEGWDIALGGLPFNTAVSEQRPLVRQTAQAQKQQTDTSREPGEHSLAFWWLKAQSSFHGGAGQSYLGSADTDNEGLSRYRYDTSEGVDVFSEPGTVSLLPRTTQIVTTSGDPILATTDVGYLYVADGATLTRYWMAPFGLAPDHPSSSMSYYSDPVAWGGGETIVSMAVNGADYFLATATGIYRGTGTGAATKIYTFASDGDPLIRWVKQRLMLALNRFATASAVYELDPAAAAASPLPTALFSATKGWRWTAIADSPAAILIAGHNFARSSVWKVGIDASATVPVLMPGTVVAEFPPFELVIGMQTYLSTVIGVQTSKGFRVGILEASGDFQYGSLLVEHEWEQASGAVFGQGNSLYVGWTNPSGVAGLARVDLSNSLGSGQSLRFPWAPDIASGQDGVTGHATVWDYERKVFSVPGVGVFVQSHGKVTSGTLVSSRIRWDTLEPKLVRFARIRGGGAYGRIDLEISRDSDDNFVSVGSIDVARRGDSGDLYVQQGSGQQFSVRVTLTGSSVEFNGYQLRALPAQRPQRMIQIPLALYDRESSRGQMTGGGGQAMSRLLALEDLEKEGAVLALQWLSVWPDRQRTEYVIIDTVEFTQISDLSSQRGWGGIATVTLRTVE